MKSSGWIGVILFGVCITAIGLLGMAQAPDSPGPLPDHLVLLLVSTGLLACLAGATGVCGLLAWIPGLREEQKT